MMYRAYKYLYYRLYTLSLSKHGEKNQPQHNAVLMTATFVVMNIFTVFVFADGVASTDLISVLDSHKVVLWCVGVSFALINYFILVHKGKYKKIVEEFKGESTEQKKRGTINIWTYIIFSVASLIIVCFLVY